MVPRNMKLTHREDHDPCHVKVIREEGHKEHDPCLVKVKEVRVVKERGVDLPVVKTVVQVGGVKIQPLTKVKGVARVKVDTREKNGGTRGMMKIHTLVLPVDDLVEAMTVVVAMVVAMAVL